MGVDKTKEPTRVRTERYHFLWRLRSRGGVYQSFCEIMGLDSSETWHVVETLLQGYQGSSGWAGALMGSIHIQSLIYHEIRPFSSTKLYPFWNFHFPHPLIKFFSPKKHSLSLYFLLYLSTAHVWVLRPLPKSIGHHDWQLLQVFEADLIFHSGFKEE